MKQKTVINDLIDRFERRKAEANKYHEVVFLDAVISELQTTLLTEKEQIVEAVDENRRDENNKINKGVCRYLDGADYYQQTYGNEDTKL